MTNINAEETLQFQALSNTQHRLMGVLCEKGKTMKMINMKIYNCLIKMNKFERKNEWVKLRNTNHKLTFIS